VPILALFGTTQETVPFDRLDTVFDRLQREAKRAPSFQRYVFEDANHFYSGYGDEVAAATPEWLREIGCLG